MQRLSTGDLEGALRFVQEAAAETGPDPFPEHVLERFRVLMGCDWATFCELDRVHRRGIAMIEAPVPPAVPDEEETFWRIVGIHPLCRAQQQGRFDALKLSDFHSRRELHRTEIYAEWFGPADVEYELEVGIPSPPEHTKTFLFDDGTRDFSERERALANLLQPHLVQLYRAAAVRRVADRARIVAIDRRGALEPASAEAQRLLHAYDVHAAIVADWLGVRGVGPLTVEGPSGTLVIDVDRRTGGDVLVLTERPGPAPAELTPREHEVLELVRDGLQNAEIAERLWVSPATVRKHLENIYEKLGVHTRTAAVARVHGPR